MTEDQVIEVANSFWCKQKKQGYAFKCIHFIEGRDGRYSSPSRWIVRYQKPYPKGSVIDDGDYYIAIIVDPISRKAKLAESL